MSQTAKSTNQYQKGIQDLKGMFIEENNIVFEDGLLRHTQSVVIRQWSVNCLDDHDLDRAENQILLKSRRASYGVDNIVIAPGYSNP